MFGGFGFGQGHFGSGSVGGSAPAETLAVADFVIAVRPRVGVVRMRAVTAVVKVRARVGAIQA